MSEPNDQNQRLLPWYVNGTLTEAEMARMEEQRQSSPNFQQAIATEIGMARLFSADISGIAPALAQQPQAFNRLREKIAGENQGQNHSSPWRKILQKQVPVYAVAASVLLTTCLSFLLWQTWQPTAGDYQVLTSPSNANGVVMQLIFEPDIDPERIQQLLNTRAVQTLSGPSVNRVYRVQLENQADIKYWQQHPQVRWAEMESP